jgi:hypothetical protein
MATERVTRADVTTALERLARAVAATGGSATRWSVQEGSQTYGRAWRLFVRDERGALSSTGLPDYLGWSAREARDTLDAYTSALWFAARSPLMLDMPAVPAPECPGNVKGEHLWSTKDMTCRFCAADCSSL